MCFDGFSAFLDRPPLSATVPSQRRTGRERAGFSLRWKKRAQGSS